MARILFLLTKTPWRDRRPYNRQAPALLDAGHQVIYVSGAASGELGYPYDWVHLSTKERDLARRVGGLNLYWRITALKPDVVQLCSFELLPIGLLLKAVTGIRVVYDCREDIASAQLERRVRIPLPLRNYLFRGIRWLEARAGKTFDGVITADPGVSDLFSMVPKKRKMIFYNTGLLRHFSDGYPRLIDREYDLVVLGSMGSLRSGTQDVLDALGILHQRGEKLKLLLIGEAENGMKEEISRRIEEYKLHDYVHFTGNIVHTDVPKELVRAKIGIVGLHDYPKFHRNIACKAFEYMACGMPTIATNLPPQHLFLDGNVARFYPPGDIKSLADSVQELLSDISEVEAMGARARKSVEKDWNGELEQKKIREFYASLLKLPFRSEDTNG